MAQPFIGEIKLFAGNFPPRGWAFCNGALLPIAQYDVVYALIGTTYGGDGVSTFALPDFRSRVPVGQGTGPGLTSRVIGELGGTETVTLTSSTLPSHTHSAMASTNAGNTAAPGTGVVPAKPVDTLAAPSLYVVPGTSTINPVLMAPNTLSSVGSGQPHTNMMPTLGINYVIALEGVFPSRN